MQLTGRSWGAMRRVAQLPELRRIELGFAAFSVSEHATWLAVLVYALERGGPSEVGIVAVVQLLPGVVLAPFAAYGGDRFAPQRALAVGYAAQSVSMAATATAMAAGTPIATYAAAACAATAVTFTRPALASLLPTVTHAPKDLVVANAGTEIIEQVGVFVGPLVSGVLLTVGSPSLVFAAGALATGLACAAALRIDPVGAVARPSGLGAGTVVSQVFAGFATLRREGRLRVLVGLGATAGFIAGIADVVVVTFVDARLDGGGGRSALLASAYGLGGIITVTCATQLLQAGRVGRSFLLGGMLAGAALLVLAVVGGLGPSLLVFAVLGGGETLLHLTSWVAVQRQAPTAVLARVFGILEGLLTAAVALGSLTVTVLVAWTSFGAAFVVLATAVPLLVLGGVARLRRHGADPSVVDDELVQRLLTDPVFAPLPAPTVERLARSVERRSYGPDEVVTLEGTVGTRYFLVTSGRLDVTAGGGRLRELGAGSSFGEIALLRDVPRTATVTTATPVELLAVERDEFLAAVTGHPRSLGVAGDVADGFFPS